MLTNRKYLLGILFFIGLFTRFACIYFVEPITVETWFAPFMSYTVSHFSFDPWSEWLKHGGTPLAFPYGYAMWLSFLPITLIGLALDINAQYTYKFTLLIFDLFFLILFFKIYSHKYNYVLAFYWLSPIIILATYIYGFNDLIPAFFLTFSLFYLKKIQLVNSGLFLVLAISAKSSMIIAAPFFLIYLHHRKQYKFISPKFFIGFFTASLILILPFMISNAAMQMLIENPELKKVYLFVIDFGAGNLIYVIPIVYSMMLYFTWNIKRINFELLIAIIGITFLLIVLLMPSSPGWFAWCIPYFIYYQFSFGSNAKAYVLIFSLLYLASELVQFPIRLRDTIDFNFIELLPLRTFNPQVLITILNTALVVSGLVLVFKIWQDCIFRLNFFRLSRKPFSIGIAGDSGSGKDVFADALFGIFGSHSVVKLSGDNYHLWDRRKPIWKFLTHLNPMANQLEAFGRDLVTLLSGKPIYTKVYDHSTGIIGHPLKINSNDFIIVSGLHAFYLPILRDSLDLKIYLDMDEDLRVFFKTKRDVYARGYSVDTVLSSIEKRRIDAERYIYPQVKFADLIISIAPVGSLSLVKLRNSHIPNLKVRVQTKRKYNEHSLIKVLIGICGLHVDISTDLNSGDSILIIDGDCQPEDIALAVNILCPNIQEFFDLKPKWEAGALGIMQLIAVSHINQVMTKGIT